MTQSTIVKGLTTFVLKDGTTKSVRIPGGAVLPYCVLYQDENTLVTASASARWSGVDLLHGLRQSRVQDFGLFRWDSSKKQYIYDTAHEAMYKERHGNVGAYSPAELEAVDALKNALKVFSKSAKKRMSKEEASSILENLVFLLNVPEIAALNHESQKQLHQETPSVKK
jgi:hypothetical protein